MDFFLLGILLPLLILIGIVANIFSFVALQKLTLVRGSTYLSLLRWQALLDSSLLLTFFLISSLAELSSTYRHSFFPWTVPFLLPLGHIFLTGRVYGLVSITAEQLLITIGHRLADRFFTLENIPIQFRHISHTGENSNSFPTEVLLLATFYPLLSWLLSPTSLSGLATRLPSQRKACLKLSSPRRGQAGSISIFFLPISSSTLFCLLRFFPRSFLDSSSTQGQELEG